VYVVAYINHGIQTWNRFFCFFLIIFQKLFAMSCLYFEFCGTHIRVLDEWYGYLENMVEWFK
jgi:hypothetical protein